MALTMQRLRYIVGLVPFLSISLHDAFGQDVPRWELGPTISMIKLRELHSNRYFGPGVRAVWNFSEILGTELQFARIGRTDFFPLSAAVLPIRQEVIRACFR